MEGWIALLFVVAFLGTIVLITIYPQLFFPHRYRFDPPDERDAAWHDAHPSSSESWDEDETDATAAYDDPAPRLLAYGDWWPVVQQVPNRVPHTAVLGPSGEGKSSLLEALARNRDGLLMVIQPNRQAGEWPGVPVVECDDDGGFTAIVVALQAIQREFTRRGGAMKAGDPGPWLTVVWDEVPLCIDEIGKEARMLVRRLVSAGRPRKMRLMMGSTSDRVGALGLDGVGDLLESCAVIRLGAFATAADPRTRGTEHPTLVQVVGEIVPAERGPVLDFKRTPVEPARIWVPMTPAPGDPESPREISRPAESPREISRPAESPREISRPAENPREISRPAESPREISRPVESDFQASGRDFTVPQNAPDMTEIARIAAAIATGKGKTETLTHLPGYSGRRHKELGALYEQIKAALDAQDAQEQVARVGILERSRSGQ